MKPRSDIKYIVFIKIITEKFNLSINLEEIIIKN